MKYFDEEDIITEYEKQLQKKDNEIERLNKENKLLQDMDKIIRNENTNLKLRISKAIDYIENNEWYTRLRKTFINNLLDILKGVDKE